MAFPMSVKNNFHQSGKLDIACFVFYSDLMNIN